MNFSTALKIVEALGAESCAESRALKPMIDSAEAVGKRLKAVLSAVHQNLSSLTPAAMKLSAPPQLVLRTVKHVSYGAAEMSLFGVAAPLVAASRVQSIQAALKALAPKKHNPSSRGKNKIAREGSQASNLQSVIRIYKCIWFASELCGPNSSWRAVIDAVQNDDQIAPRQVAEVLVFVNAITKGQSSRYERALRQAIATLLKCPVLPEVTANEARSPAHRPSYGKLSSSHCLPAILIEQMKNIDLRGLDHERYQADMVSLAAELACAENPLDAQVVTLANNRNEKLMAILRAGCVPILEDWLGQHEASEHVNVSEDPVLLGLPINFQGLYLCRADERKQSNYRISESVACAATLLLMLCAYNFESILNGRFQRQENGLFFFGRKPRADMASTAMRIELDLLEKYHEAAQTTKNKPPALRNESGSHVRSGISFEDKHGWHQLSAERFRQWFAGFVEPQLTRGAGLSGYNYSNVRPLVAQLYADRSNGELAPVQSQLHHAQCSETVDYVDSPEQRVRLDRVAAEAMLRIELTCLSILRPSTINALGLDRYRVSHQFADFCAKYPDAFTGAVPAFFDVGQAPNFASGRLARRRLLPPPPVAHTAALWRAAASILVAVEAQLNVPPLAATQTVTISVALPGGGMQSLDCTPYAVVELVDVATNIALALSGLRNDELLPALSSTLEQHNGTWRAKFVQNNNECVRIVSATAAKAISVHQQMYALPGWRLWGGSVKRPVYLHPSAKAFNAFCKALKISPVWAASSSLPARTLFTTERLRLALACLWDVMAVGGVFASSAFAYQSADHRNRRVTSTNKARLRALQADPIFSLALRHATAVSTTLAKLNRARAPIPSLHLLADNDNVAIDLALPGWRRTHSQALQLVLRRDLLKLASDCGLYISASFREVRAWNDARIGLVALMTNSLTSKNARHGDLVIQIQNLLNKPGARSFDTVSELLDALPMAELAALNDRCQPLSQHSPGSGAERDDFALIQADHGSLIAVVRQALASTGLDRKTVENYAIGARKFCQFAAHEGLNLLGVALDFVTVSKVVERWVCAAQRQGHKPSTINKDLKSLRLFMAAAKGPDRDSGAACVTTAEISGGLGVQPWLPCSTIEAIKQSTLDHRIAHKSTKERRVPSDDDLSRLLAAACKTRFAARNRALVLLTTASTLRVSEVLSLTDADLRRSADGKYVFVSVWQKSGSQRMVTLAADLIDMCFGEDFHAERQACIRRTQNRQSGGAGPIGANCSLLFLSSNGNPLSRFEAASVMANLSRTAGIEQVGMHALRRKGLSEIKCQLDANDPDAESQLGILAGHAASKTTMAYYVGVMKRPSESCPVASMLAASVPSAAYSIAA